MPTLLIPSAGLEPPQLAEIHKDMQIMSRILDKALASVGPARYAYHPGANVDPTIDDPFSRPAYASAAATFRSLLAGPTKCMEAVYLDGFGALFVTRVDFPVAPVQSGEVPSKTAEESVWEQTKQELRGVTRASQAMRASGYDHYYGSGSRAQEYEEQRVYQLARTLLAALGEASNIRGLRAEDSVAVAVLGGVVKGPLVFEYPLFPEDDAEPRVRGESTSRVIAARPTALTIRLKKSDIDAFAHNDFSFDTLRRKATILAY